MPDQPNIILLCPDEMKASALGLYGQAQPVSPFIDKLGQKGFIFNQCHTVHPKCTPSRCSMITGSYPHERGHRTLDIHTTKEEPNFIRKLKESGYETALIGKNHVVDKEAMPLTFDYYKDGNGKQQFETSASDMPPGSYWVGTDINGYEGFSDTKQTNEAFDWMENKRDSSKPFFLWINWGMPHPPYSVPAPFYGKTDRSSTPLPPKDDPSGKAPYQKKLFDTYGLDAMTDDNWREIAATYLDMTNYVDSETERVFQFLEANGLSDNTIVVIWSDHGDFAGEHQLTEKWDTSFYDCITRVPLIFWGPGIIPEGRTDALTESIDLFPTLFELLGLDPIKGVAGKSAAGTMKGTHDSHRDLVFCQGGQEPEMLELVVAPDAKPRPCEAYQLKQKAMYEQPSINSRAKMIRNHNWKYCFHQGGFEELYNLEADPHELHNLAKDSAYESTLIEWRQKLIEKLIDAETRQPWQNYVES